MNLKLSFGISFFLLFTLVSCDPYNFGFKANPAQILIEAFEAVQDSNVDKFKDVSGKEALCLYGNEPGLEFLKNKSDISRRNVDFKLNFLKETYFENPQYVNFWSYLTQRYSLDVVGLKNQEVLLQVVVDCHYGVEGEKNPNLRNLKRSKYKRKECRLIKIIPKKFGSLPMTSRCQFLKVDL